MGVRVEQQVFKQREQEIICTYTGKDLKMGELRNGWTGKGYVQTCDLNKGREVHSAKYGRGVYATCCRRCCNALTLWDIIQAGTI